MCIRSGVWSVHNQLLRELAVNGSSHRPIGSSSSSMVKAVNHNCRPGSTEKRSVSMFLLMGLLQNVTNIHAEHVLALSL